VKHNNAVGPQVRQGQSRSNPHAVGVLLAFALGLIAATQWFAYQFAYQAALGTSLGHIYAPWQILLWANAWYTTYPEAIMQSGSIGMMVSTLGLIAVALAKMVAANTAKAHEFLHGSARWANRKDIEAAGLLNNDGVYVGAWKDKAGKVRYLRHNGPEHVLCYAPTRSGKGVGLVIPTLLSWPHSAIITDLKGELWALTAGWRQKHAGNRVLRFDPAAGVGSVAWNPLEEIRIGTDYVIGDVQNLANLIVDPDGKGLESHWQKTSHALLVSVILHVLYKSQNEGTPATLPAVDALLTNPKRPIKELWREMISYAHVDGQPHAVVASGAQDMIDRPEEEAGSVLSTAKSYLALYRDPVVANNVSKSQFRIRDLMNHDDPVSLYIVTHPNDKSRLRPLARVLVNMIVRLLADKMEFESGRSKAHYKHRLLLMMDEFPSLGRLDILQESLAFIAGYGIKAYLICQDINQLKSRETGYGHDEAITSNCHIQNAFPPNRVETAEYLSKLTGQTTILKEQITTSGGRSSILLGNVSRTQQEVQRPLLTVDEALRMPGPKKNASDQIAEPGDMVIYAAGFPAIYGRQPLYFHDLIFQARAEIPAPDKTDCLIRATEPQRITL